ncbi:MAG: DUF3300 domain-containing protein [Deltaproteobacteria bacterium]|nr:DUF3300 domain-containing protein [Deltaproteobacteria bacterium]
METKCFCLQKLVVGVLVLLLAAPPHLMAQGDGGGTENSFTKEQLSQLVAPIALYPDSLLSQILMASTYPLEVVEGARFVKANAALKGDALDAALKEKSWDVSVKSLCHFPEVLGSMSEKLDQTTQLGNAFLGHQEEVMEMVQELRAKAHAQGNLETTKEQTVVVENKVIVIESPNPQVIYVPTYNPIIVYGTWPYPAYPPYAWYYPPGRGFLTFGVGIAVGIGISSWSRCNWRNNSVNVNINRTANFNRNVNRGKDGGGTWKHNPKHRKGASYRNQNLNKKYGQSSRQASRAKARDRGYGGSFDGKGRKDSVGKKNRSGQSSGRTNLNRAKGGAAGKGRNQEMNRTARSGSNRKQSGSAFSGSRQGKEARMSSQRGQSSRQRSGGGGSHRGGRNGGGRGRR